MNEEQLLMLGKRLRSRLRDATQIRVEYDGVVIKVAGMHNGEPFSIGWVWEWQDNGEQELMAHLVEQFSLRGFHVLPVIGLITDMALDLNGHRLRISELQQEVTARSLPRKSLRVEDYSADEGLEDVERLALVMFDLAGDVGKTLPQEFRVRAAFLLSRLHGWKRGAPEGSPGHQAVRDVAEPPVPVLLEDAGPTLTSEEE